MTLLESQGLVAIKLKKTKDNHKNKFIELNVCIEDVEKAVSVSPILMGVLEQGQEALRRMRQKV